MSNEQLRILAEILASQARIIGMQANNQAWAARGDSPCYDEGDFEHEACKLELLGQEALKS
ncbi:hypothetical protein DND90_21365 [Pseudomonas syringae pv. maculicola]|nr:hypothetical protein DND90_21365 [Pseudomonas syringae pv. maculicola]